MNSKTTLQILFRKLISCHDLTLSTQYCWRNTTRDCLKVNMWTYCVDRLQIVDGGNLAVQEARQNDEGKYQCVAKNTVGSRESQIAQLKVHGTKHEYFM